MLEDLVVYPKGHIVSVEFRYRFLINNSVPTEEAYCDPTEWYFVLSKRCPECDEYVSLESKRFPSPDEAKNAIELVKQAFSPDYKFEGPHVDRILIGYEVRSDVTEKDILHSIRSLTPAYQVHYLQEFGLQSIVDRYFKEKTVTSVTISWSRK